MHSQLVSIRGVDELMHRRKHSARGVRLWSCSPRFQGTRRCACAAMLYRCAGRPVTGLPAWAPSQGATWARACLGREGPGWLGAAFFQRALISMIDYSMLCGCSTGMGISKVCRSSILEQLESADSSLAAFLATVTPLSLRPRVRPGGSVCLKQDGWCVGRN